MPTIGSPLSTSQPYIPLVNATKLSKAGGLHIHFPTMAALLTAVATERSNITAASPTWSPGQPLTVSGEPAGVFRTWFIGGTPALSNANTVVLPSGQAVVLPNDSNVVLSTTGAPSGATGVTGDLAVDFTGNVRYVKTGTSTWSSATAIFSGGGAVTGVPAWATSTVYVAGQRAIHSSGRLVTAYVNHTSITFFDAEKWVFPTDDGSTVFDFSQLPNGNLDTVHPTKGRLHSRSILSSADWDKLVALDGKLQALTGVPNFYFEAALVDTRNKVQHLWCIVDCVSSPDDNTGITFLFPEREQNLGIQAGIHSGVLPRVGADYSGVWRQEAYPANLDGIRQSPTYTFVQELRGRTTRFDITLDLKTGMCTGYVNGLVAWQYVETDILNHVRHTASIQFPNRNFQIKEFGISPTLPKFAIDGSARRVQAGLSNYSALLGSALTTTFQKVWEFPVAYDAGGAVEISMPMLLNCTAGYIEVEHGTSTVAANQSAGYVTKVIGVGEAMVYYSGIRTGTPNTTELVGLWARVSSGGAGQIRADTFGNNCGSPRWRPVHYRSKVDAT